MLSAILLGINFAFGAIQLGAKAVNSLMIGSMSSTPVLLPFEWQEAPKDDQVVVIRMLQNHELNCLYKGKSYKYAITKPTAEQNQVSEQGYAFILTHKQCGTQPEKPIAVIGHSTTWLGASGLGVWPDNVALLPETRRPEWLISLPAFAAGDEDIERVAKTPHTSGNEQWYAEDSEFKERQPDIDAYFRKNDMTAFMTDRTKKEMLLMRWQISYQKNKGWLSDKDLDAIPSPDPATVERNANNYSEYVLSELKKGTPEDKLMSIEEFLAANQKH